MKKETIFLVLFLTAMAFAIGYIVKLIMETQNAINVSKAKL